MDYLKAHAAAVRSLTGSGLTLASAEEIVSRMEESQSREWQRTLERVASGEAKHVRLFVVWNSVRDFMTFLYSGDQDSTVAYLFRELGKIESGAQVPEDGSPIGLSAPEVEGYNPVNCFDIAKELRAVIR